MKNTSIALALVAAAGAALAQATPGTDSGKKLAVRGDMGMPLLGRTQTWVRAE